MNDDAIADLKQFIATTIRTEVQSSVETQVRAVVQEEVRTTFKQEVRAVVQEEVRTTFKQEVRAVVQEELEPVNQKIDDLTDFVRESLDISNEATGEQLADHETRITDLEHSTAA